MGKTRRGARAKRRAQPDDVPLDGAGLVRQAGAFEAATGLAHGPVAIAVAIVAALLIRPVARAVKAMFAR